MEAFIFYYIELSLAISKMIVKQGRSQLQHCQKGLLQIVKLIHPNYKPQPELSASMLLSLLDYQDGPTQTKAILFELINTSQLTNFLLGELDESRIQGLELQSSQISLVTFITRLHEINTLMKCKQIIEPLEFQSQVRIELDLLIGNIRKEVMSQSVRQLTRSAEMSNIISKDMYETLTDILKNKQNYASITSYHDSKQFNSYKKLKYVQLNMLRNIINQTILKCMNQNNNYPQMHTYARKMYIKFLSVYVCLIDPQNEQRFRISQFHAQKNDKQNSCLHFLRFQGGPERLLNFIQQAPPNVLKQHMIYFESIMNPPGSRAL